MKSELEKQEAESQIISSKEPVSYDTREYPVEVLIKKFKDNEFLIPNYQREFIWVKDKEKMSKFIESIILDLPIPYLFFADEEETGKLEIVDGSQRIRTIVEYFDNKFELEGLEVLDSLNGFKYSDLLESRQRRFLRKTMRSIELTEKASSDIRRDLFSRFNSKPYDLLPMEVRKGTYDGPFYEFLKICSSDEDFIYLCPISLERQKRGEAQELVLRFFAYSENYMKFVHRVDDFLDDYMKDKFENGFDFEEMHKEFLKMIHFVKKYFPYGFKKAETHKTTPRVRFEAIAVGVNLALKESPDLIPKNIISWLESKEFKIHTTSDASNSKTRVIARIEFVKNKLLGNE